MKTILIAYSYPTSTNAEKYRFPNGCYVVSIRAKINGIPNVIAAFKSFEDAYKFATSTKKIMGITSWDKYTLSQEAQS